jgi:hypothetical protein
MATNQARLDEFPSEPDKLPGQRFELLCGGQPLVAIRSLQL